MHPTTATKLRVDRWSCFYLAIMVTGWVAAAWFLFLSMGGGFLGIFLNWCLGFLLLVPIGLLLRDLIVRRPHSTIRLVLGIFVTRRPCSAFAVRDQIRRSLAQVPCQPSQLM